MGRRSARMGRFAGVAALAAGAVLAASAAYACGFHNPSDVARGAMNLIYPKSLYVRTAVWQAQHRGLLPPRPQRVVKDLFAYQRMAAELQKLAEGLGPPPGPKFSFTIVLLDSMLWTRYTEDDGRFGAAVHVESPGKGDAVLVTQSEVIRALNEDALTYEAAEAEGLIRLYGPLGTQQAVRECFRSLLGQGQVRPLQSRPNTPG